jgi:Tfp pilus assembly protein PilN
MRPVNLIPPEERRGESRIGKQGVLAYGVIGALAVILLAVVALRLTSNQIADREAELATLQAEEQAATARATALKPYADFAVMAAARNQTVTSLAQSRFDWERVLRELSLVLPDDIWLTSASGTASPGMTVEGAAANPLRAQVPGPALELTGCGAGQESVAAFTQALKDIDGVTRVGLSSSERPSESESTSGAGGESAGGGGEDCRTKDFIAKFEIVVAFDSVPVPSEGTTPEGGVPATATTTGAPAPATTAPSTDTAAAEVPGATETQTAEQEARDSTSNQSDRARNAANALPGGDSK